MFRMRPMLSYEAVALQLTPFATNTRTEGGL